MDFENIDKRRQEALTVANVSHSTKEGVSQKSINNDMHEEDKIMSWKRIIRMKLTLFFTIVSSVLLLAGGTVYAQGDAEHPSTVEQVGKDHGLWRSGRTVYAKSGFYIGLNVPYNTIGGDFDGKRIMVSIDDLILVPKIDSNFGWGVTLGTRSEKGAIELNYVRSKHDGTWMGLKGESVFNMVSVDFKGFFLTDKPIQPFLLYGIGYSRLVVKDGSVNEKGDVGDGTFSGLGANLGAGLAYYIHPRFSVHGGIIYRAILYFIGEGVKSYGTFDENLYGGGLSGNIGVTYTF